MRIDNGNDLITTCTHKRRWNVSKQRILYLPAIMVRTQGIFLLLWWKAQKFCQFIWCLNLCNVYFSTHVHFHWTFCLNILGTNDLSMLPHQVKNKHSRDLIMENKYYSNHSQNPVAPAAKNISPEGVAYCLNARMNADPQQRTIPLLPSKYSNWATLSRAKK